MKGVHLGCKRGSFVLFTYIGLALGRRIGQSSNLAYLEIDVGTIE